MFLKFLAALARLTKKDRVAFIDLVKRLGQSRRKIDEPDQEEFSERQDQ